MVFQATNIFVFIFEKKLMNFLFPKFPIKYVAAHEEHEKKKKPITLKSIEHH